MQPTDVDPAALDAFASRSRERATEFETARQQMQDGRVDRMSFGIMPAAFMLFDRYTEQVEACLDGLAEGAGVMDDIADGVTLLRDAYTAVDEANADMFRPAGGGTEGATR
jgi:hypothetical protein